MNNLWCTNYSSVRTNTRFTVMRFYEWVIARKDFAFNLTAIKELIEEGIRGITPGDWVKCVEHVFSVDKHTYWLKENVVEEDHEPCVGL